MHTNHDFNCNILGCSILILCLSSHTGQIFGRFKRKMKQLNIYVSPPAFLIFILKPYSILFILKPYSKAILAFNYLITSTFDSTLTELLRNSLFPTQPPLAFCNVFCTCRSFPVLRYFGRSATLITSYS